MPPSRDAFCFINSILFTLTGSKVDIQHSAATPTIWESHRTQACSWGGGGSRGIWSVINAHTLITNLVWRREWNNEKEIIIIIKESEPGYMVSVIPWVYQKPLSFTIVLLIHTLWLIHASDWILHFLSASTSQYEDRWVLEFQFIEWLFHKGTFTPNVFVPNILAVTHAGTWQPKANPSEVCVLSLSLSLFFFYFFLFFIFFLFFYSQRGWHYDLVDINLLNFLEKRCILRLCQRSDVFTPSPPRNV